MAKKLLPPAPRKPSKPYPSPSAEDDNVPQEILDEAQRQLRIGRKEAKGMSKGGKIRKMARGGGIEERGKTKGRFV